MPMDERVVVVRLTEAVEGRVVDDQQARLGLDAHSATRQMSEQRRVVREDEACGDRRIGIEQIGDPLVETAADSRVNGMRVLQNRPFELDQPSPITGGSLSAQLLDNRARGASGEAEIPDGHYVVRDA